MILSSGFSRIGRTATRIKDCLSVVVVVVVMESLQVVTTECRRQPGGEIVDCQSWIGRL